MSGNKFCIEYAKRGTAGCKKCKTKIDKQVLRIAKIVANPFSDSGGDMKNWFHVDCIFDQFSRARATTKVVDDPSDLDGWEDINDDDKKMVLEKIKSLGDRPAAKKTPKKTKKNDNADDANVPDVIATVPDKPTTTTDPNHKDNSFREFRRLCAKISEEPSYNEKTAIIKEFFTKGSDGTSFQGDLYIWVKLLLPRDVKRVYNLQSKQLVKLFSQIFKTNVNSMITDLEKGDVAETVYSFFESSKSSIPCKKSKLGLFDVDEFLDELSRTTKEDDQQQLLKSMCDNCTSNDLKMVIRLIKHDLRINAGSKHILDAVHDDAYQVFQASRNLYVVIEKVLKQRECGLKRSLSIGINLMTPVLPMLAEACKSVEHAMKKCPNGMYAEVKYDGERVQLHKQGNRFAYFSRSLKPVVPHKVQHFKDFIPKAFPHGKDLIIDSEVLLIDNKTSKPLPFGTLSKHKKTSFTDANVCLFIFDCLMYNGTSLMDMPIIKRREFLMKNMTEIPNRIMFSNAKEVQKPADLKDLIMQAIDEGLEGLVLKDLQSIYEPGKRHWLKVKKDYLAEGAMADTADLVVLGAYFGTGNKGGKKSIFLMGCLNKKTGQWCTVTKVHGGHDDKTLEKLQTQLDMIKISKDVSKIPHWLNINTSNKSLVPDFVARDPKASQVWEITGAEFSKADSHTANGISIRFPRVTRIRKDKTWETATNLAELETLFKESKKTSDVSTLLSSPVKRHHPEYDEDTDVDEPSPPKKKKVPDDTLNLKSNASIPDIFTGLKIFIPSMLTEYRSLKRYVVAFDGEVVDDLQLDQATHVVVTDPSSADMKLSCQYVVEQWLWDCIKLKKLLKTESYSGK